MQIGIVYDDEMRQHVSPFINLSRARVSELHEIFSTPFCQFEVFNQPHPTKASALVVPFPTTSTRSQTEVPAYMVVFRNTGVK